MKIKKYFALLMLFVGILSLSTTKSSAADMSTYMGKYYNDFESFQATENAANSLNETIGEEGFILMKNDGVLPFAGVKRISVFGKNSVNLAYGGGGSGAGDASAARTVNDSLIAAGYEVNAKLSEFYKNDSLSGSDRTSAGMFGGTFSIGETPIENYTRQVKESFDLYNDAAVIVITRSGSEGADNARKGITDNADASMHYLQLNQDETDMIDLVKEYFDKIVVVINNSAPLELGVLEEDEAINGVVWVGHPGNTGIMALGRILNGSINPSGRTVDIYPTDFTKDPTYQNFGDNSHIEGSSFKILGPDGNRLDYSSGGFFGVSGVSNIMYEEGIYIGYRYYETRMAEINKASQLSDNAGEEWYQENVIYPFGYGLSYTTFDWDVISSTPAADFTQNGEITVNVKVTNTGKVAGKDVVQLYYTAPYINGEIEKSHVVLGAFEKTNTIKPGQFEVVTLTIHVQDMASYDYNDANNNGFKGYELDPGTYEIKIMKNSHELGVDVPITYTLNSGVQYENDRVTGEKVKNRFTGGDFNSLPEDGGVKMTQMSRSDFEGTFPVAPTTADLTVTEERATAILDHIKHVFSLDDVQPTDPWFKDATDAVGMTQVAQDVEDSARTITYQLSDLIGVAKDDPKWTTLLNELKFSELVTLVANGRYSTAELAIIGKDHASDLDGPAGISGGVYWASATTVASTWNEELAEKQGQMIGNESLWLGINGWYAPAMNTHRSQFAGRNFEYFSEDPILAGKMSAAVVNGAQSKGLYSYIKHFALNDQETNRFELVTYANEQAIREIYLKAFQLPVQEANAHGIMSSFNRIGLVESDNNYALLTQVLRNEWGFKGLVVTDMHLPTAAGNYMNPNALWPAGNDIPLGFVDAAKVLGTWDATKGTMVYTSTDGTVKESYTQWLAIRQAAHNVLYVAANSNLMNNVIDFSDLGEELGEVTQLVKVSKDLLANTNLGTNVFEVLLDKDSTLPEGLVLSKTGILSGTPTVPGTYTFTINVAADNWVNGKGTYTITVTDAFAFTGDALDSSVVGEAFSTTMTNTAFVVNPNYGVNNNYTGYKTVTYAVRNDSLPAGLTLTPEGVISGTPTAAGEYVVELSVNYIYRQSSMWGSSDAQGRANFEITIKVAEAESETPTDLVCEDGYSDVNGVCTPNSTDVPTETTDTAEKNNVNGIVIGSSIAAIAIISLGVTYLLKKKK